MTDPTRSPTTVSHAAAEPSTDDQAQEGIALALEAEDGGDWKPLAGWLARHPDRAGEVARFLADQSALRGAMNVSAPEYAAGTSVGGFEIRETLAWGGMGVVYRAFDPRLKRDVAVKLLYGWGALSEGELARFRFEAETVASLDHPNIVPVHSWGEHGGRPYLVMPLMTGGSLADRLRELGPDRRLPPREAAGIVRDVALGVHHAHQRGLIHRDLKPGNILLDRDGGPHVADFGLAHPAGTSLSTSAGIAGTPAYMAPEQARGEKHLTTAVDVHALGVILFELLTGRTPFGGGDIPTVLRRVSDDPPPAVRDFRPEVDRDLDTVCRRCLSKDPQQRYSSAKALADDLDRYLNGEWVGDRRSPLLDLLVRVMGRRRETLAMGSWAVAFWGGASTILAMGVMQAAVLLEAPLWVAQAALGYYLLGWLGLMWVFLVVRRDVLNPVERSSTALHFGAKFACFAVLPVQLWYHGGDPVYALPPFLAIVGLAVFAHGFAYWGRFYLVALLHFAAAAAMPLVPPAYWPSIYGLLLGGLQVGVGVHLRRVHEAARAAGHSAVDPTAG